MSANGACLVSTPKKNISICAVRAFSNIDDFEDSWNKFVGFSCNNPFHLHEFTRRFLATDENSRWRPLLLIAYSNNRIIGVAPLKEKRQFGIRLVKFVSTPPFSPDFVIADEAREHVIGTMLDFLFSKLGCHLADLCLPIGSMNVDALKQNCSIRSLHLSLKTPFIYGHRVLPITCDWNDYEKLRGSNFRNKMRKIERKFDKIGEVKVTCLRNPSDADFILERILEIENVSWKESWRRQKKGGPDTHIPLFCNASIAISKNEPNFEWMVYFLELDKKAIAYSIVLRYKETAFIGKITYDERYRRFYPGIFLINSILKEEFNLRKVKTIDFQTDMQFMDTWTKTRQLRLRAIVSKGFLPFIIQSFLTNDSLESIRKFMPQV
jgi:hypothetical protein